MATNKAPAVVASLTVEIALAMILVAGRVYVRAAIKGTFGIDDVILIIGFVSSSAPYLLSFGDLLDNSC